MSEATNQMPAEEQAPEANIPQPETVDESVFDDLYQQASNQLEDSSKLPIPPDIGDFDVCEVLSAPYVFS